MNQYCKDQILPLCITVITYTENVDLRIRFGTSNFEAFEPFGKGDADLESTVISGKDIKITTNYRMFYYLKICLSGELQKNLKEIDLT